MIAIVEMLFGGWIHEECNAGMIEMISDAYRDNDIVFLADCEHIEAVKYVGIPDRVRCYSITLPSVSNSEKIEYEFEHENVWKQIQTKIDIEKVSHIYVLASFTNIVRATVRMNQEYQIPITFVIHANMDRFIDDRLSQEERENYKSVFNEVAKFDCVDFITFGPKAKEQLANCMSDKFWTKLFFVHHPMQGQAMKSREGKKLTIGVWGQCVNKHFIEILKCLYDNKQLDKACFKVLRRTTVHNLDCTYMFPNEGVDIRQSATGFSKQEILEFMQGVDWILLPYDDEMYRVSMSGILADAIRYEKPIIALNSPCIDYYNQLPIGIVESSVENLCTHIVQLEKISDEEYNQYILNEHRWKKIMEIENQKLLVNYSGK